MSRIELVGDGRRILVPILILRPHGMDLTSVGVVALLDTGATTSGISESIARELQLSRKGKRPLGSARGIDQVERYLFRIALQTGGDAAPSFPYIFEPTLGFEITAGTTFSALLGMDILSQCDVHLQPGGRCTLTFG